MTQKQIKALQNKIDKQYEIIDDYFRPRYEKANTKERIQIRNAQRAIHNVVEYELTIERECNQ